MYTLTKEEKAYLRSLMPKSIKLLDNAKPQWREMINVDTLDVQSTGLCVLGQVFESFGQGLDDLNVHFNDETSFVLSDEYYTKFLTADEGISNMVSRIHAGYETLTQLWILAVEGDSLNQLELFEDS